MNSCQLNRAILFLKRAAWTTHARVVPVFRIFSIWISLSTTQNRGSKACIRHDSLNRPLRWMSHSFIQILFVFKLIRRPRNLRTVLRRLLTLHSNSFCQATE